MATTYPEELVSILVDAGVGTLAVDVFESSRSVLPNGDGPYTMITVTGGTGPDYIMNDDLPPYRHPGAQVMVTGKDPIATRAMAVAAYDAYAVIGNEFIGDTWYIDITPTQEPHDLGTDAKNRIQFVFNIITHKKPS